MQAEPLTLEVMECTSSIETVLNTNCCIDASNLIYLSGASLVFHNIYQNVKTFTERVTDYPPKALACLQTGETVVAVLAECPFAMKVEFYSGDTNKSVEIAGKVVVLDMSLIDKKTAILICKDEIIIAQLSKKARRIPLEGGRRLVHCENRVFILLELGMIEFELESEAVSTVIRHPTKELMDYATMDGEFEIIALRHAIQVFAEGKLVDTILVDKKALQIRNIAKINGNIIVAYHQDIIVSQFAFVQGSLQLISHFPFPEKVKGTITSMRLSVDQMTLALSALIDGRMECILFNLSALCSDKKFISAYNRVQPAESSTVVSMQTIIAHSVYYLAGQSVVDYAYAHHTSRKTSYPLHQHTKQLVVHPLGHQCLCIFDTQIKFYQKVELELVEVWTEAFFCSAAKYTTNGLLLLALYEDGAYSLVLYDPNAYRKLSCIPGITHKMTINRIAVDSFESQVALYVGKDLFVNKLRTGERVSEFRAKKEGLQLQSVVYDTERKCVFALQRNRIVQCKKIENCCVNFSHQRVIQFTEEVSCIRIHGDSILIGFVSGKIKYSPYPMSLEETGENVYRLVGFRTFKVHCNTITDIYPSNNNRFLFVVIRNAGMSVLRMRHAGGFYGQVTSYNYIQTSSKLYLSNVEDRLKVLLEKRKTVFNQLEEFKKDAEAKKECLAKELSRSRKKKELVFVEDALRQIEEAKNKKKLLAEQLAKMEQIRGERQVTVDNRKTEELLALYKENDQLKKKREEVREKCKRERVEMEQKCKNNLRDITEELQGKYLQFLSSYQLMKNNLEKCGKKIAIEKDEDSQVIRLQEEEEMQALRAEEEGFYSVNNELKSEIARSKKELDRFSYRRDFLDNKSRFFAEEVHLNEKERVELEEAQEQLERELKQLQELTHDQEQRLSQYFNENKILEKYQYIHDHLLNSSARELHFLQSEKDSLSSNISRVQKQISDVAGAREVLVRQTEQRKGIHANLSAALRTITERIHFASYVHGEMQKEIQNEVDAAGAGKQFTDIHKKYYHGKGLDKFIAENEDGAQANEGVHQMNKKNQNSLKEVLQDHQGYLQQNMILFEKHNARVAQEIVLHHLKHQTQNYNLIAECNIRKTQTLKKKKILHQLINQVKAVGSFSTNHSTKHLNPTNSQPQLTRLSTPAQSRAMPTPYTLYEKGKQPEKRQQCHDNGRSTVQKVRRLLDVHSISSRRIQTASNTGQKIDRSLYSPEASLHSTIKPQTSQGSRRYWQKNDIKDKPTTCASQSKYSEFI